MQLKPLTEREKSLLQLRAQGYTNEEIAGELCLTMGAVRIHMRNIYSRLNAHNGCHAVGLALSARMIEPVRADEYASGIA